MRIFTFADIPPLGQLNQAELSARIDDFLITPAGEIEHLHNQLIAGIYGNVTREMPDQGVASWVSANDKPTTGAGSKPVSGDAAEQRLKTEVMQLPSRDRRRLKDLSQNEVSKFWITLLTLNEIRGNSGTDEPTTSSLTLMKLLLACLANHAFPKPRNSQIPYLLVLGALIRQVCPQIPLC